MASSPHWRYRASVEKRMVTRANTALSPYSMASPDVGADGGRRARARRITLRAAPLREGVVDIVWLQPDIGPVRAQVDAPERLPQSPSSLR